MRVMWLPVLVAAVPACSEVSSSRPPMDAPPRDLDAGVSPLWAGPMPSLDGELRVADVDGRNDVDLISVSAQAIHTRLSVVPHGFGASSDTPFTIPAVRTPLIANLDGAAGSDVAIVRGNMGTRHIDVFRSTVAGGFEHAATLPAASDEDILAVAAFGAGIGLLRLVALVETPAGRRLRVYPGQPQAAYTAASASDYDTQMLASVVTPVIWAGDYERVYVATTTGVSSIDFSNTGVRATAEILAGVTVRSLDLYGSSPGYLTIGSDQGIHVFDGVAMTTSRVTGEVPTSTVAVLDTGYAYARGSTLVRPPPAAPIALPFAPTIVRSMKRINAPVGMQDTLVVADGEQAMEILAN